MKTFTWKQVVASGDISSVTQRPKIDSSTIFERVKPIIDDVRNRGDEAVLDLTEKFDGFRPEPLTIDVRSLPPIELSDKVKEAVDIAFNNIEKFHAAQYAVSSKKLEVETMPGVVCSRIARPISRVGLYIPGGSAVLPSTTLMLGIPAKVVGCKEIVIATPPKKDGTIAPEILYVAQKIKATKIVKAGGAQAIASMALGTATVPKVDKICGPGNQYVTAAKMLLQNDDSAMVSIDMPAGPSEVLVVADDTSNPSFVASDLLSQAEHGPDSQVVLLAVSMKSSRLADIHAEIEKQVAVLPRAEIARTALSKSFCVTVDSVEEAASMSNLYAPEHLIISTDNADDYIDLVENAGSVFLGHWSPESCGDYASGTNHTLPTYGYAKMYSGVSVDTFLKYITLQKLSKSGLKQLGPIVETLAEVEELHAHKNAVTIRLNSDQP